MFARRHFLNRKMSDVYKNVFFSSPFSQILRHAKKPDKRYNLKFNKY